MSPTDEFQSVPVPSQHVAAVYRFLADLDSGALASTGEPGPSPTAEEDPWTDETMTRLAQTDKKAVIILGKILTALSNDPGEWYSLKGLEGATGETQHQMRYIWSSLTRHFQSKYGTRAWPVDIQWGIEFTPRREPIMYYKVSEERAEQWKRITGK